jgi:hypothetical protein
MKKLALRLDDLQIDSFQTTPAGKEGGTVLGEQCTCPSACSCPGCPTCDESCTTCVDTCEESCEGTCDLFSCRPDCTVSNLPTRCDGYNCI